MNSISSGKKKKKKLMPMYIIISSFGNATSIFIFL